MARRLNVRLLGLVAIFLVMPLALALVIGHLALSSRDPKQYTDQAKQYLENKEFGQAWIAIRNASRAGGGKDPQVQYLLAQIAMKQNPPAVATALQACRSAVALKPDFADAQRMLAEIYVAGRYWKEARTETDRLIQIDPSFGKAYVWAGLIESGLADAEPIQARKTPYYEAAVQRLQAGLEKAPSLIALYDLLARTYERMGQAQKADEVLNLAIANNPTVADAYLMKGSRLLAQGKPDQAADVLKKGLEKVEDKTWVYVALGKVAVAKKDYETAKDLLLKAVALDPKSDDAPLFLAGVYRTEGDRAKALAVIESALAQSPESGNLLAEQADLCIELGDFKKAEQAIAGIAKATPQSGVIGYLRGKRAILEHQARQAIALLEESKAKQPTPQTRLLLGRAYLLVDELGAAQSELDSLIQDYPAMAGALRTQAEVQLRLRDFEKAARCAAEVIRSNPDDIEMRLLLAQTMLLRQRPQDALKEAQAAAERSKNDPAPYLLLAEIQQRLNKPAEAEAAYRRAVTLGGKNLMRVYDRFVQFYRTTKQDAKLQALLEEAKKALPPEEAFALTTAPEAAEKELAQRAAAGTASVNDLLVLGGLYQLSDHQDLARQTFDKVLATAKPGSPEWRRAWQQMFILQVTAEAYDKVTALIERYEKIEPDAPELLFAESLVLLAQNKLPEATEKLRAVTQAHKTVSQGYFLLGQVLLRQRQWDEAATALARALELRPNLLAARLILARLYLGKGNYSGALNEAGEALKFDVRLVSALDVKALAHSGLGQWDQAIATRESIVKLVPDNVPNLVALAALYVQRHTPEKAEEVFARAHKLAPDNTLLVRAFAAFYADTGRVKQGEALVDDYVSRHKDDAGSYILRGEFAAKASGPAESEKYFRKAAEMTPKDAFPLVVLGEQYARAGEWEKAGAVYAEAVERAKTDPVPRKRLADVYMLTGKLDQAKAVIDAVLKQAPTDAGALVIAGRIAGRRDKPDEAKRYMEQALSVQPDYGEAKVRLAELYGGPDPLRALDILSTVDPADQAFEKAMLLRSNINTRRVQLREAILDLRRLLDYHPTSVVGRMSLASRYMAIQEYGRAAEILGQLSKERLDKDPSLLLALGDALSRQEHWAEALARYEKARELQPALSDALVGEVRCLVALKRPKEAEKRIYDTMNKFEKEVWPRLALVAYHEKMGEMDKAFEDIRNGLLKDDKWEIGYVSLADLLMRAGRGEEARVVLRTGLAKVPQSIPMRGGLAAIDIGADRPDAAAATLKPLADEFETKRSRDPDRLDQLRPYMPLVRVYALALYSMGKYDESLKWGMRLWELDPTDVANANNMAWLLATEKKDYIRAREMIDRCKRLVPNHPQILDTSGWIYFFEGRLEDATDDLLASVKTSDAAKDDNPEARYHLGCVYEKRERPDEARVELQKALDTGLKGKDRADAEKRLKKLAAPQK